MNKYLRQLRDYCSKLPELKHLCMTDMEARRQIATLDAMEVTALKPGDTFYLDLRVGKNEVLITEKEAERYNLID